MVLSGRSERSEGARVEALRSRGSTRLWLALALPPLAWFVALNAAYFFVSWTCARDGGAVLLHAITIGALAVTVAAGVLAWGLLRDLGSDGDDGIDDRPSRTRFLARLAVAGAAVFALTLIAQWLAILVLDPCATRPRLRFSPDALHAPGGPSAVAYVHPGRNHGSRLVLVSRTFPTHRCASVLPAEPGNPEPMGRVPVWNTEGCVHPYEGGGDGDDDAIGAARGPSGRAYAARGRVRRETPSG